MRRRGGTAAQEVETTRPIWEAATRATQLRRQHLTLNQAATSAAMGGSVACPTTSARPIADFWPDRPPRWVAVRWGSDIGPATRGDQQIYFQRWNKAMKENFSRPSSSSSRRMLRQRLERELCSDSEFEGFCITYFPEAYSRFGRGMDRIEKINFLLQITDIDGLLNALDEHLIDLSDEMEIENDLKGQSFNKTITRKSKSLSPLLVFLIIWTLAWETLKRIFIWIGKGISHALSGSSFVATSASVVVLGGASITTYYLSRPLLISYSESSPHISKKQNMENSEIHQERNNNDLGTSKSPDLIASME